MGTKRTSRRDYGTGSVFQRASDGVWIGRLEAGWKADGTRRRIQVSAKTEAECKRRLVKKKRELEENGAPPEDVRADTRVKAYVEQWIARRGDELSGNTLATYRGCLTKWVVPTIGNKRLTALTPGDVRAVTVAERTAGNAESSTIVTRRVLMKMLRDARVDGHNVPPRIFDVKIQVAPDSDRDAIPLEDAGALLRASLALPHTSRWIVAFFEGMRQGECLGLTWDHVDLERGLITVEYQLDNLPYLDRAAGTFRHPKKVKPIHLWKSFHLVPTKSKAGRRVIPLVGPARLALEQWGEVAPTSPHGLVWPRLEDGMPRNNQADSREWTALQDAAQVASFDGREGRRYDGHEIRHTTATLLLEIGADPETVRAILGHSSIITSRGYQHASTELRRDAMEKVADRLSFTLPERPAAIEG